MKPVKGLVLIVIGILWWFTNAGLLDGAFWDWLLPVLVIALGLKMVVLASCQCEACRECKDEKMETKSQKK
ncbi:MAG: hypothetical protein HYV34_02570 [Candidatus Kerfeldbacteria bacterium]|nr:hypothetical protein [Candidatus Kerfeldbacteria bacterium]